MNLRLAGLAQWVSGQPELYETLPCPTSPTWRDGSVGRVPGCHAQGPGFRPQHCISRACSMFCSARSREGEVDGVCRRQWNRDFPLQVSAPAHGPPLCGAERVNLPYMMSKRNFLSRRAVGALQRTAGYTGTGLQKHGESQKAGERGTEEGARGETSGL